MAWVANISVCGPNLFIKNFIVKLILYNKRYV